MRTIGGFKSRNFRTLLAVGMLFFLASLWGCGGTVVSTVDPGVTPPPDPGTPPTPPPPSGGGPGTALLSWGAPTLYNDGTSMPSADIGGFKVYFRSASAATVYVMDVSNITFQEIRNLTSGQWFFAISCYDVFGNEGPQSLEVAVTVS